LYFIFLKWFSAFFYCYCFLSNKTSSLLFLILFSYPRFPPGLKTVTVFIRALKSALTVTPQFSSKRHCRQQNQFVQCSVSIAPRFELNKRPDASFSESSNPRCHAETNPPNPNKLRQQMHWPPFFRGDSKFWGCVVVNSIAFAIGQPKRHQTRFP
jgi:hypothetical protein